MSDTMEVDKRIKDKPEVRKMKSITHRLHLQILWKKLGIYLGIDILALILIPFLWIMEQELREIGQIDGSYQRSFTTDSGFWGVQYVVTEGDTEMLRVGASYIILFYVLVMGGLILYQFLSIIVTWHGETKRIRKTLKPINDIAMKADAMSRLSFSDTIYGTSENPEEAFRELEQAISGIDPNQESMPSLGNRELQGIEAAMNNLLRRMHDSYQQQARFVNDASHELRTPIAVIQGYANMLDRWGRTDEDVLNESISAISHEADHMNQLVEQLLFLARGDSGRTKLKEEDVELVAMMEEIYEESLMIDEGHPYHFRGAKEPITITGDPTLLKQSVRILVDNAAKYTKAGDEITLSVGMNDRGEPYLQVQDGGIGMSQADVEHMFERFYRSDETREVTGSGLGLAIAKWIVDRHGGHFEILSRTELGTRIRILLPKNRYHVTEAVNDAEVHDAEVHDEEVHYE